MSKKDRARAKAGQLFRGKLVDAKTLEARQEKQAKVDDAVAKMFAEKAKAKRKGGT